MHAASSIALKYDVCVLFLAVLATSCQKPLVDPAGNIPGGSSSGNLLTKVVSVTATDTNTVLFRWDSNNRLVQYLSLGKTNGIYTNTRTDITRAANGDITRIDNSPLGTPGTIDSTISYVFYEGSTSRIAYVKRSSYIKGPAYNDSIVITYNAAGRISSKETYNENPITGVMSRSARSNYNYDGNGNLTTDTTVVADLLMGGYVPGFIITNTYDTHIAPHSFGDESFIIMGLSNEACSPNHLIKKVQTGSGTGVTITMSQFQFNGSDRPQAEMIAFTPVPPGYLVKTTYFYQ